MHSLRPLTIAFPVSSGDEQAGGGDEQAQAYDPVFAPVVGYSSGAAVRTRNHRSMPSVPVGRSSSSSNRSGSGSGRRSRPPPPWLYGSMTREQATSALQVARNGSMVLCALFLVREKVPGVSYAISLLAPSSLAPDRRPRSVYLNSSTPSNDYVSTESLSVVHHLVQRATRVDGTHGRHFVLNDEVRMAHCTTIEEVVQELSLPDDRRMPELPASLGLPLIEACVKTCDQGVASVTTDAWACPACSTPFCTFVGGDRNSCAACRLPGQDSSDSSDYVSFEPVPVPVPVRRAAAPRATRSSLGARRRSAQAGSTC